MLVWICLQCRRPEFDPWVGKFPWRREWQPTLVFLPGEFCEQKSLVDYSPWGRKELDMSDLPTLVIAVVQFCHKITPISLEKRKEGKMTKERRVVVLEERDIFFPFSKINYVIEKKCILIMKSLDNK